MDTIEPEKKDATADQPPRPNIWKKTREQMLSVGRVVEHKVEPFKYCVESLFFILAIGWALYIFIYTDRYKPARENPQLTVTSEIEKVGQHDKIISLKATLKVHNTGKVKVRILSAYFNLLGYKLGPIPTDEVSDEKYPAAAKKDLENATQHNWEMNMIRFYRKADREFLQSGSLLLDSWLEPGEEYKRVLVLLVPEENDFARFNFDIWSVRDCSFLDWRPIEKFFKTDFVVDDKTGALSSRLFFKNCLFCDLDQADWQPYDNSREDHKKYCEANGLSHNDSSYDLSLWALPNQSSIANQ